MRAKFLSLMAIIVALVLLAGSITLWAKKPTEKPGKGGGGDSEADPAILTINDSFGGTPAVGSDIGLSGLNFYVDQQLDLDGDEVADDPCVVSTVSNTGLYWADMVANCGSQGAGPSRKIPLEADKNTQHRLISDGPPSAMQPADGFLRDPQLTGRPRPLQPFLRFSENNSGS